MQNLSCGHASASAFQKRPLKGQKCLGCQCKRERVWKGSWCITWTPEISRSLLKRHGPARAGLRVPLATAPNQRSRRVCDGARLRPLNGDKRLRRRQHSRAPRSALRPGNLYAPGALLCLLLAAAISLSPRSSPQSPVRCDQANLQAFPPFFSPSLGCSRCSPRRLAAGLQVSSSATPLSRELTLPGPACAGAVAVLPRLLPFPFSLQDEDLSA